MFLCTKTPLSVISAPSPVILFAVSLGSRAERIRTLTLSHPCQWCGLHHPCHGGKTCGNSRRSQPTFAAVRTPKRAGHQRLARCEAGHSSLKVVESDEERQLYDIGHIPTAVRINWATELGDPTTRDIISAEQFGALMDSKGISRDDTVVIYGDQSNKWALYTLWIFEHYGHPDVRLLDGGRDAWMQEEKKPATTYLSTPPLATQPAWHPTIPLICAFSLMSSSRNSISCRSWICAHLKISQGSIRTSLGTPRPHPRRYQPQHRQQPLSELSIPPNRGLREAHAHLDPTAPTVVYCNDAATAAQQWFVLTHLLGWEDVRVYDGSWVEWGNMMRMPITR